MINYEITAVKKNSNGNIEYVKTKDGRSMTKLDVIIRIVHQNESFEVDGKKVHVSKDYYIRTDENQIENDDLGLVSVI